MNISSALLTPFLCVAAEEEGIRRRKGSVCGYCLQVPSLLVA